MKNKKPVAQEKSSSFLVLSQRKIFMGLHKVIFCEVVYNNIPKTIQLWVSNGHFWKIPGALSRHNWAQFDQGDWEEAEQALFWWPRLGTRGTDAGWEAEDRGGWDPSALELDGARHMHTSCTPLERGNSDYRRYLPTYTLCGAAFCPPETKWRRGRPTQRRDLRRGESSWSAIVNTSYFNSVKKASPGRQAHKTCAVSGRVVQGLRAAPSGSPTSWAVKTWPWLMADIWGDRQGNGFLWLRVCAVLYSSPGISKGIYCCCISIDSQWLLHGRGHLVSKRKSRWIQNRKTSPWKILLFLNDCKHGLNSLDFPPDLCVQT